MEQDQSIMEQYSYLRENCVQAALLFAEYDAETGVRAYSSEPSELLYGNYINRDLITVLCEDDVTHPDDLADLRRQIHMLAEKDSADFYARLRLRDSSYHLFRLLLHITRRSAQTFLCTAVLLDAEQELLMYNRLQYLSEYDPQTAIYNQHGFSLHAHELITKDTKHQYVIIRTNIERFKVVNDLFGIEQGDALLRRMAHTSLELTHGHITGQAVFGRIRADIFACCCENTEENIAAIIEYIRRTIGPYFPDYEVRVGFGLYEVTDPTLSVDLMIDRANMAMQTTKGNYLDSSVYYSDSIRAGVLREQFIVGEMGAALREGQFFIVIQPKCDMDTGQVIGGEALARWRHPDRGIIPPSEFVPVFEKSSFIFKLDCFVWEETCRELRREIDDGYEVLPVSVNLSRVDIQRPELLDTLSDLIRRYRIPLSLFRLEITESGSTPDIEAMLRTVGTLRERGFDILLDDFGSAFSTFNVLSGIDISALKIDLRSIAKRSRTTRRVGQLLTSFVFMADQLGIPTIIEGVETKEQVELARSAGIHAAQGYFYYRPQHVQDYRELLEKRIPK